MVTFKVHVLRNAVLSTTSVIDKTVFPFPAIHGNYKDTDFHSYAYSDESYRIVVQTSKSSSIQRFYSSFLLDSYESIHELLVLYSQQNFLLCQA